ncbi:MAG: PhoH family protein [Bacteroidales bacterium]
MNRFEKTDTGELLVTLSTTHPSDIFGLKEEKIKLLRKLFPKLRIVLRGNELKAIGDHEELDFFQEKMMHILEHFEKLGKITDETILEIITSDESETLTSLIEHENASVLLHGKNGMLIKARTPNQARLVESSKIHDMVFAIGPAGTGKTYTAVALAVRALKNKEVRRIILTRPAVEAGESLGFLPGDLKEKLDPYLQPLYDALRDMIPPSKLEKYLEDKTIEIAPLAFMRGRTLDNAFAILDESQNATESQLKMFLTRMGKSAKFIITGDITQIDLPKNQTSGLITTTRILNNVKGIDFIFLNETDVVRHPLVSKIIRAYEDNGNHASNP